MTNQALTRDPSYAAEIKLIHTAAKALALTEDSYRDVIRRFSGNRTDSSAKLTPAQRGQVIKYFRELGFAPDGRKASISAVGGPYRRGDHADRRVGRAAEPYRPQIGKLSALWHALYQLGVVRNDSREACEAFVCRHTKIEKFRWNHAEDLRSAIECLKAWCIREGYEPRVCDTASPQLGTYRPALIHAQWSRLIKLGAFKHGATAGLDTWMANQGWRVTSPCYLEDDAAEEAIRRLGQWLRRISRIEGADGADTTQA